MHSDVKTIFLDGQAHPVIVSASAYPEIERLILAARVCRECGLPYSDDEGTRPRVAVNTCLICYLARQQDIFLYIGKRQDGAADKETFLYQDAKGMIFTSTTTSENAPKLSVALTLIHYGFPVPDEDLLKEIFQLSSSQGQWYLYGDILTQSVVVIVFRPGRSDGRPLAFLSYKHGEVVGLHNRRGLIRQLYKEAKRRQSESSLYAMLATLASAEYDARTKDTSE